MQLPIFTTTTCACMWLMESYIPVAIFRYFVIIILYRKTYIFYSIYFIIQYNMLNWFSLQTLQSLNIDFFRMLNIFFPKLHSVSILLLLYSRIYIVGLLYKYLLYLKKNNTQEHRWFLSSYLEKNLQQNKGLATVNKIVILSRFFFRDSRFF